MEFLTVQESEWDEEKKKYINGEKKIDLSLTHPKEWKQQVGTINHFTCCGLAEFYSNHFTPQFSKKAFEWWLSWKLVEAKRDRTSYYGKNIPWGGILIGTAVPALRADQEVLLKWFKDVGFVFQKTFFNNIHKSIVHLYHYDIPGDLFERGWKAPLSEERKEKAKV